MKHIKYITAFILAVLMIMLTACSTVKTGSSKLRIGVTGMNGNFSPFYAESEADKQISSQIYQTVQIRGTDNRLKNFCGGITYKADGEKVKYTVSIKDDLYFSDGRNVTIDDVIFFYHFIADASYDGVYKDWYLNDIEGLKEYYFDDKNYASRLIAIDSRVKLNYSPSTISASDLEEYLIATEIDGKFNEEKAPDNTEWKAYFEKAALSAQYEALGKKPEREKLLKLAASAEAAVNAQAYNAVEWYKQKLTDEYIKKNYENGINVSEISGIKKINDYSCTILFNSHDINAVSAINAAIISKEFYSVNYVKGLADKVRDAEEPAPGCGAYVLRKADNDSAELIANKYYPEKPDFDTLEFENYENDEKVFNAVKNGNADAATVFATSERISKLTDDEYKYFVTNDDGYYSVFLNPSKLDITERKALCGICSPETAIESKFGKSYTVPLRPLSVRFAEYPSGITEKKYGTMDYTSYLLNGVRVINKLNGYYCGGEDGVEYLILNAFKDILAEKKIILNIVSTDENGLKEAVTSGKADIWVSRVADGATSDAYGRYNSLGAENITGYGTPEIDEITAKIHTSVGLFDRTAMTEKALETIFAEALECPVCQLQKITVYNTSKISADTFDDDFNYDGFAFVLSELKGEN